MFKLDLRGLLDHVWVWTDEHNEYAGEVGHVRMPTTRCQETVLHGIAGTQKHSYILQEQKARLVCLSLVLASTESITAST